MAYVKQTEHPYRVTFSCRGRELVFPPRMQPFAVEILREFSSTELVGKLCIRVTGSWLPPSTYAL